MKNKLQKQWDTYVSSWKASSESKKLILFKECLSTSCIYRDPVIVAKGWDELISYMLEFHKMIPGGHFVTREFKSHNNRSIAEWDMCAGDGAVISIGISYGEYNEDGQLIAMTGFFDPNNEE